MPRFACECRVKLDLEEHFVVDDEHKAAAELEAKDEFQELILDVLYDEIVCNCVKEVELL